MDFKGVNIKRLQYINELLIEQMNHWFLFPFVLLASVYSRRLGYYFSGIRIVAMWMFCSLLPLAFFIMRLKIKKSVARFILLQPVVALFPVVAALAFLISDDYLFYTGRLICMICTVCYMFHSILLNLKKKDPFTGPMQLSLGVSIAVGGMIIEMLIAGSDPRTVMGYRIFSLVISIGLYFIIIYIQRYIDFLNVNKSSAGYLPATEMFHSGFGLALGYTVFSVVLICVVVCGPWLGKLGMSMSVLLEKLLRWIAARLRRFPAEDEIEISGPDSGMMPEQIPDFKINETSWFWKVLEYVFIFVMLVALLVIFVKFLIKLIQFLQRLALSRISFPDAEIEEAFDIHERCDLADKRDKKGQKYFGQLSYSDRIRRLYKRKLLSSTGQMTPGESKMLGIYTAREWEQKLATQGMADLYEQARYSGQEMTAEDVKRMKDACR